MNEHQMVLRRVGLANVIVGVIDTGYLVYCIANNQNYSSGLNIFAVIAGILLIQGSLQAARIVTWLSALGLTGLLGATVLIPYLQPIGLWALEYRLNPIGTALPVLIHLGTMLFLFWVYKQLRSPSIVQARISAGQKASPPYLAFFFGIVIALMPATIIHFAMNQKSVAKAVQLAQEQLGSRYKYHVKALSWSGGHYSATVIAYNLSEIKSVQVEWWSWQNDIR